MTTSGTSASPLQERFRAAGIIASEVGLRERFHFETYDEDVESLFSFCDSRPELQFSKASEVLLPIRSASEGDFVSVRKLHHVAFRSILVE